MGENLDKLQEWAKPKGLTVQTSSGDQRDPVNVCAIREPGGGTVLIRRTSLDSIETAAMYVLHTLDRLGARDG